MNTSAVIFAENSKNKKIRGYKGGKVSSTYASIEGSCPSDCDVKDSKECYAMLGPTGMHVNRLDEVGRSLSPLEIARQEAKAIAASFNGGMVPQDGARGGRDLRIHTAGDCKTDNAAKAIAAAIVVWYLRGGGSVWTYSHAWKKVKRSSWGKVSVLASLNQDHNPHDAFKRGYAPARIVAKHKSKMAYLEDGIRWVPCPAQTSKTIGCADCRLCLNADALHAERTGIDFEVHGVKRKKMQARLTVLGIRKAA